MQQKWKTFIGFAICYSLAGFITKLFFDHVIESPISSVDVFNQTVSALIAVFFYVLHFQRDE
jgi:hypothetical protein